MEDLISLELYCQIGSCEQKQKKISKEEILNENNIRSTSPNIL